METIMVPNPLMNAANLPTKSSMVKGTAAAKTSGGNFNVALQKAVRIGDDGNKGITSNELKNAGKSPNTVANLEAESQTLVAPVASGVKVSAQDDATNIITNMLNSLLVTPAIVVQEVPSGNSDAVVGLSNAKNMPEDLGATRSSIKIPWQNAPLLVQPVTSVQNIPQTANAVFTVQDGQKESTVDSNSARTFSKPSLQTAMEPVFSQNTLQQLSVNVDSQQLGKNTIQITTDVSGSIVSVPPKAINVQVQADQTASNLVDINNDQMGLESVHITRVAVNSISSEKTPLHVATEGNVVSKQLPNQIPGTVDNVVATRETTGSYGEQVLSNQPGAVASTSQPSLLQVQRQVPDNFIGETVVSKAADSVPSAVLKTQVDDQNASQILKSEQTMATFSDMAELETVMMPSAKIQPEPAKLMISNHSESFSDMAQSQKAIVIDLAQHHNTGNGHSAKQQEDGMQQQEFVATMATKQTEAEFILVDKPGAPEGRAVVDREQLMQQITNKLITAGMEKANTMRIQLNPEHLGAMVVQITVEQGIVSASFQTENNLVKQSLENSLPQLKQQLSEQGFKVDHVTVNMSMNMGFSQNFDHARSQQQTMKLKRVANAQNFESAVEEATVSAPSNRDDGAIDYIA